MKSVNVDVTEILRYALDDKMMKGIIFRMKKPFVSSFVLIQNRSNERKNFHQKAT